MKFLSLATVLSLILCFITTSALSKEPEDLDLAGVEFGQSLNDLKALAKQKNRDLVGPSKGILDIDSQIQCTEYRVAKDRTLSGASGITRQAILILNNKVIGAELHFTSSIKFKSFLKHLEELGYTTTDNKVYVGELKTGDLAGSKVEVRIDKFRGGNRGKKWKYIVMARCLEVLGKGVTLEKIKNSKGKPQERKPRKVKTLKGLESLL